MKASLRLVDSISGAMSGAGADGARLRSMAVAYADACEKAEERLARCEEMLSRGESLQAVQFAEAEPPLLDEVAALEFLDVDRWREACRDAGLPVGEIRNRRAIRLLNEAYSSGLPSSSPLYRDYRAAVAARDDAKALEVLAMITRLNPADANASKEADRLRRKMRDARLKELSQLLDRGDNEAVLHCVDAIEALDVRDAIKGDVWQKATRIAMDLRTRAARERCETGRLAMAEARESNDYGRVLAIADAIQTDCAEHSIRLSEEAVADVARLEKWALELEAKARKQNTAARLVREFGKVVDGIEDGLAGRDRGNRQNLEEWRERLSKLWLDVERAEAKPDPQDIARFKRCSRRIDSAISRIEHRKHFIAAGIGATALALALIGMVPLWISARMRSAVSQLEALRTERRCESAAALVQRLERRSAALTPAARTALDGARVWIDGERAAATAAGQLADVIEGQVASGTQMAALPDLLRKKAELQEKVRDLSEELRPKLESRLAPIWDKLESERARAAAELATRLRPGIEALLARGDDNFGFAAPLDKTRGVIGDFEKIEGDVLLWKAIAVGGEPTDLADRIIGRIKPLRDEVRRFDGAISEARAATSLDPYIAALKPIAYTKLTAVQEAMFAREVVAMSHVFADCNRLLFSSGIPRADWDRLKESDRQDFHPADVLPEERDAYLALRDADSFFGIFRLFARKNIPDTALKNVPISEFCVKGEDVAAKAIAYQRSGSTARNAKVVIFETVELVPASQRTLLPECQLFERSGIRSAIVIEGEQATVKSDLLKVLDLIRGAEGIDPVFKAAVHLQILGIASKRPIDWGIGWSPTAQEDARKLTSIASSTEMGIRSSDWLLPDANSRKQQLVKRLGEFYLGGAAISYHLQALAMKKLAIEGMNRGLVFCGFVGPDGRLLLHPKAPKALQLWGWSKPGEKPRVLFERGADDQPWAGVAETGPFQPLFGPSVPPQEILQRICDSLKLAKDGKELAGLLPPIFSEIE